MRREYDFSKGERGKFYRQDAKLNLPRPTRQDPWAGDKSRIAAFIMEETKRTLRAYQEQPNLVTQDANHEHDTAHGGYAHRQLFELVQNGADALTRSDGASILVRLTGEYLYCADDGKPIDEDGVRALMFSHMSSKRDTSEIGRFGLGFKSVLGVTDSPEFYSRPGSFRFDRQSAALRIAAVAPAARYPVLRLPVPADALEVSGEDEDLREMMTWATNIVRLPLKPGVKGDLAKQIEDFPPEFLLFVDHVRHLSLEDGDRSRDFALQSVNGEFRLDTGEGSSRWKCFKTTHDLSAEARGDRRSLDDSGNVPIWWAAPLDGLNEPGYYWSFFPTKTASYLSGILNAPWKTNEDRQNLLPGPYNDELIDAAARTVAEHLPKFRTEQDPARHLDALPRRPEAGDNEHGNHLRERLDEELRHRPVAPDQAGTLRGIQDVSYAPRELTEDRTGEAALEKWVGFDLHPTDWLHHSALTINRMAKIDRIRSSDAWRRSSLSEWLEALVEGFDGEEVIAASMAAVQTAAAIPEEKRKGKLLGKILLTQGGTLSTPDPESVFLPSPDEDTAMDDLLVHPNLISDAKTAAALDVLGIKHFSAESRLRFLARKLLNPRDSTPDETLLKDFWDASHAMSTEQSYKIIKQATDGGHEQTIHARVRSGEWRPLHSVLLPGEIVPSAGDRDRGVAIDTEFHDADLDLLKRLGATATPTERDLRFEPSFNQFEKRCRDAFRRHPSSSHSSRPQPNKLHFRSTKGSGPLKVLELLSDEGKASYTDALLSP